MKRRDFILVLAAGSAPDTRLHFLASRHGLGDIASELGHARGRLTA